MFQTKTRVFICLVLLSLTQSALSDEPGHQDNQPSSIEEKVRGLVHMDGFFDLYWDQAKGRLFLRIDNMGEQFIYQSSMPRGVGSNDLGLDRGELSATKLVEFFRSGPKILLLEKNTDYRAISTDQSERLAVESSFALSAIWGFDLVAETNSSVLVDATDFFLHDSHGLSARLSRAQQGSYEIDPDRSVIFIPRTKAFPDNTEIEAMVSYTGEPKYSDKGMVVSDILSSVVPDPTSVTVHLHHSFIRLPDNNYVPLPYDARSGVLGISYSGSGFMNFAAPIDKPVQMRYGRRHRLEKLDPLAEFSEAVEPIIYYLDPGVPEPIRSALLEGANWWNQAFEAAGYINAFRVKLLPEWADPMDVRFNVIQWVHRSTRGWSYGASVVDPRTGEILKGHVSLGSLRVRQDYLIAEGLLAPYQQEQVPDDMLEMSLARIRQLSAHEVGHTLGMEHNFAASVNDRSSVMDYPFPLIRFTSDGNLDLSDAYDVGIGEWDKRTVLYAYQDFPATKDEFAERRKILEETINSLNNFSEQNIRPGRPLATIEEVLVPIYLLHRYQIQAVGKLIGGQYFKYGMRDDGQAAPRIVQAEKQKAAISALIRTIDPQLLILPQSIVNLIPPRPPGHRLDKESFARTTGINFDPLAPAASAVSLTLDVMLNTQRAARMNAFHATDSSLPDFLVVLDALMQSAWYSQRQTAVAGAIARVTGDQLLGRLITLATETAVGSQIRAQALISIRKLDDWLAKQKSDRMDVSWAAHYMLARQSISAMLNDPSRMMPEKTRSAPPGSPIGAY
jgi:hypothetical protein